jgi:hypothetical protein
VGGLGAGPCTVVDGGVSVLVREGRVGSDQGADGAGDRRSDSAGVVAPGGPTAFLRRIKWLPGLALSAALAGPWFVAIYFVARGDFYRVMVDQHVLHRMAGGMETHGAPPGYYTATILGTFCP